MTDAVDDADADAGDAGDTCAPGKEGDTTALLAIVFSTSFDPFL